MDKPVRVFIDRKELTSYTSLSLTRKKDALTGELSLDVFMGWLPSEPTLVEATRGREILVYVGGHLAFTGAIDRRSGTGQKSANSESSTRTLNIGADEYKVSFQARGKTKCIVDSSHQHPTSTMLRPTSRGVFEKLVEPWGIELDWQADDLDLDRVRFRDGARVGDELQRIAEQCSLYVHETADGRMRVTDKARTVTGEPIVLGVNILKFQADQSEDTERSQITVKGQRTKVGDWGDLAVIPTLTEMQNKSVESFIPINVQVHGDASPAILDKRTRYEANKRSSQSKQVKLEVFHVQQTTGQPWDIGDLHYVEIPPEGVFDVMEVIELTYNVSTDGLTTSLTLSPPPIGAVSAADGFLSDVPALNSALSNAVSRRSAAGVSFNGTSAWGGPVLEILEAVLQPLIQAETLLSDIGPKASAPPLTLPASFKSGGL